MAQVPKSRRESLEARRLVETGFELAQSLGIRSLLVQADEFRDVRLIEKLRGSQRIVWLSRTADPNIPRNTATSMRPASLKRYVSLPPSTAPSS